MIYELLKEDVKVMLSGLQGHKLVLIEAEGDIYINREAKKRMFKLKKDSALDLADKGITLGGLNPKLVKSIPLI